MTTITSATTTVQAPFDNEAFDEAQSAAASTPASSALRLTLHQ